MKVIRLKDKYNFCLAEELKEPKVVNFNGKEVVYTHTNDDLFYPDIYWATRALIRYGNLKYDLDSIPEELKKLKPTSDKDELMPFLEVGFNQIREIIEK